MINARDPNAGFDSLLDTMTNAVGILIIVLAVSLLVVRDTVNRVEKLDPTPSPTIIEEYQQIQADSQRLDKVIDNMGEEWKTALRNVQYSQASLDTIQQKTTILTKCFSQKDLDRINVQEVAQGLEKSRNTRQQLAEEVDHFRQQVRQSKHALHLQRELPKPRVTIARVPDPTPAPVEAKRVSFLCRYGQVVYYPDEKMIQLLHQGIADATGSEISNPMIRISDFGNVVSYFDAHEIVHKGLRWRLGVVQRTDAVNSTYRELKAFLEWTTTEVGESLEGIQNTNSEYHKILKETAGRKVYTKYYVWGDSFPEYAIAREIADEYQISAGWVAKERDAEYVLVVSSTQTGKKRDGGPETITQIPVQRFYMGGGIGSGYGGGRSSAPASGGGSVGIIGSSPGGDFVD